MHIVLVELSGRGILISLITMMAVLAALALVWLLISPAISIGIGVGLVLLIRGLITLFKPAA